MEAAALAVIYSKRMCARVCIGESYTPISHWREIAAVSSIAPIYRSIFINSPRMCVAVRRID